MSASRRLIRPILSTIFFVGPVMTLKNTSATAERAKPVTDPLVGAVRRAGILITADPQSLVRINAGVQLAAAAAAAVGSTSFARRSRRPSSRGSCVFEDPAEGGHEYGREVDRDDGVQRSGPGR